MDNNNQPKTPTPVTAVTPVEAATQTPNSQNTNNSKVVLWLIVGLMVIILAVSGIYWYLSKQQAANQSTPKSTSQPTASLDSLVSELDLIDVQAQDADFTSVDEDLQRL